MENQICVSTFYTQEGKHIKKDSKNFDLDKNLTIQDVLNTFNETELILDEIGSFTLVRLFDSDKSEIRIKYVLHNNKIIWNVKIDECYLKDYVDTYHLDEIKFNVYYFGGLGGVDFSQIEWEALIEQLRIGSEFFSTFSAIIDSVGILYASAKALKKAKEYIEEKFLGKQGIVSQRHVMESILKRDVWSLDEFVFQYDLEDNIEFAKVILEVLGYVYDTEKNLYFYNTTAANANQKKLNELIEKHMFENMNCPVNK